MNKKFDIMDFEGRWLDSFGQPEINGVWLIWGASGNGKTSFALQIAKYLTNWGKSAYNSLEEGARHSFKLAVARENLVTVKNKFQILHREPLNDLIVRCKKRKSPQFVIIDSLQYLNITKKEYISLKEELSHKTLIFLSHAEGKNPAGRLGMFVKYDADIKVHVEGYKAMPVSRYGGGDDFVIWEKGAINYWGDLNSK